MTFALNQYSQNMKTKVSNIGLKITWPSSLSVPLVCEDGKTRGSRACTIWPSTQRYRQNGEELRRHIVGELWGLLFIIIFWAYNWTTVERLSKIYHLFGLTTELPLKDWVKSTIFLTWAIMNILSRIVFSVSS